MARIYLSSTSEDLAECREKVLKALRRMRHEVIGMEDYTAMHGTPLDECLQDVESCEVYVGLFAWRYGYIPKDGNAEQKSITELEYLKAKTLDIPSFIFILEEKASWPMNFVDDDRTQIRALRDEFCKRKIVDFFDHQDTLATKVSTTVAKWQSSLFKASITLEEHERRLKHREAELRQELSKETNQAQIELLSLELNTTQGKITNLEQSYQEELNRNVELANSLEKLQAQHPGERLKEALESVKEGDTSKAKHLFADVVERGEELNVTFGDAAYQMGMIAEGEVKYLQALEYFEKAVNFQSENTTYLNALGGIYDTLAQYDKAIEYYEQALASDLKTFGEDHPDVAIDRNNLGGAWDSKGEYDMAIDYFEQALASGLKTFGEEHPSVAIRRNNLGGAWKAKGDYDKAIKYYEQALAIFNKVLGSDHPSTITVANNLSQAKAAQ